MSDVINSLKARLRQGAPCRGLWCTLGSAFATEVIAGAGFDWLLLDMEHSPNDAHSVLAQLQVLAGYPVATVVRLPSLDPVLMKRMLDLGATNVMIPDVEDAAQAARAAASVRYPPHGIRGVSAMTRATRFGRIADYPARADEAIGLIVQIESPAAIDNIEAIAAVDGVDALFVGPGDLAARMGLIGQVGHPEVVREVERAITRIAATGKAPGLLTADAALAARCATLGAVLIAVGVDATVLARGCDTLARAG